MNPLGPTAPKRAPNRRDALARGLQIAAGFALCAEGSRPQILPLWQGLPQGGEAVAKSVLHIHLDGGLSHLDSFDPKPHAPVEIRGPYDAIDSTLDKEPFSEALPELAKLANKLVLLRAVSHGEAAHERGNAAMLTGYKPSPAITYPSFGSVFAKEIGPRGALPPYVAIPNDGEPAMGPGYLGAAYGPFSLGSDPGGRSFRVRDLSPQKGLSEEARERRRHLLQALDSESPVPASDAVRALEAFAERAYALIDDPKAREAFRIDLEKDAVRDRYGRTGLGQRLLLARRLLLAGTRYVAVRHTGYDLHRDLERGQSRNLRELDRALAALIRELEETGRDTETLVLVTTEFGRTPRINRDRGRDHWPRCFSSLLFGAGLKRGHLHGRSDEEGAMPVEGAVSPADIAATLFHLSGLDPTKRLMSPGNRPIDLVRDGRVLHELLASGL